MPVLDKLFIALGYEYDESKMEKFNSLAEKTGRIIKQVSIAFIGAATAIGLLIVKLSSQALQLHRTAKGFGLVRKELIALRRISKRLTGDGSVADSLADRLSSAKRALPTRGIESGFSLALGAIGLDALDILSENVDDALVTIANALRGATETQRGIFQSEGGFSNNEILLLEGLTRSLLAASKTSEVDIAAAERLNNLLLTVSERVVDVFSALATKFLPSLLKIVDPLLSAIEKLSDQDVEKFISLIEEKLSETVEALKKIANALVRVSEFFSQPGSKSGFTELEDSKNRFGVPLELLTPKNIKPLSSIKNEFNTEITVSSTGGNPTDIANSIGEVVRVEFDRLSSRIENQVVA